MNSNSCEKENECNSILESNQSEKKPPNYVPNVRNVLQPTWLRCIVCFNHGDDKFLLDYGRYFLLPISIVLWIVLAAAS